jgi:transposase-like protein
MKKSSFSEAQIVGFLKVVERGAKDREACRKHGISEPTYCKWKSQFSGMTVSLGTASLTARRERQAQAHVCIDPVKTCSSVTVERKSP